MFRRCDPRGKVRPDQVTLLVEFLEFAPPAIADLLNEVTRLEGFATKFYKADEALRLIAEGEGGHADLARAALEDMKPKPIRRDRHDRDRSTGRWGPYGAGPTP